MPLSSQAFADSETASEPSSSAFAIKVSMVESLRRHLRLPNKERKARFFVDPSLSSAEQMYVELMTAVREHWGWLPDDFQLHDTAIERESAAGPATTANDLAESNGLPVRTAADLERALASARELGVTPTFKLVATVPERLGPPPRVTVDPAEVMADNPIARMVSFYTFKSIADPAALKAELEWRLAAVRVLGSVYVAAEGVNGQLMVRADMVADLRAAFDEIGALADVEINMGDEVRANEVKPFHGFKVTHKGKVLQDGLPEALDLATAGGTGEEIPAEQWHAELSLPESERPLLLDCRNWYESEVGRFDGSVPLNTSKFHESWPKLEEALRDVEPGRRVLTYCTGGIRCVKVGAYLTQKLGLTNVARLEHGIVGYKRWVDGQRAAAEVEPVQAEITESLFRGFNFVFDQRVGVKVTDDQLTTDPILSLIYAEGEGSQPLREAVYHETRKQEENGGEQ
jgi:predicted sulfurtransferase